VLAEDEIPARLYAPYVETYDEYCHALGIAAISDELTDQQYQYV